MTIKPLTNEDWIVFSEWATAENWRISFQEQRLFQSQWRPYFYVLWHKGERCAFISAVIYKTSAWIGNLIVPPTLRKRGYGSELFHFVLGSLSEQRKITRVWLTASELGVPLYRQHGFVDIDQIERWQSFGRGAVEVPRSTYSESLIAIDRESWGESRATLLRMLADDGCLLEDEGTAALLQPGLEFWVLGPWSSRHQSSQIFKQIVDRALDVVPLGKALITDTFSSSGTALILKQAGFEHLGTNRLMCCSNEPVEIEGVVSLASLGSIG